MSNILSSRAMLAALNVRQWSARKLDRKVTNQTNSAHGAAHDAGRYEKALLAGNALAKITGAANAARADHYRLTLPWANDGSRILSAALHGDYAKAMRKHKESFEAAVAEFVADYPAYVEDARRRLNGMFDASDYPHVRDIARRFTFATPLFNVPNAADFRVDIAEAQADQIRAEIEATTSSALTEAMGEVWTRIGDVVGTMAQKLNDYQPAMGGEKPKGIFRDSLVENVRDLAAILPGLNITGDSRLAAISDRINASLVNHDADTLRDRDTIRETVAKEATSIVADMAAFMA